MLLVGVLRTRRTHPTAPLLLVDSLRRRTSPSKVKQDTASGDVIFCNLTSFVDVLYFSFRYGEVPS